MTIPRGANQRSSIDFLSDAIADTASVYSGFRLEKGGLALVCPRCITPSQNTEDLPILEPSALFSLSRYGRVASWHRVGVGGGAFGRRSGWTNSAFGGN
jgi:hypothetical protein